MSVLIEMEPGETSLELILADIELLRSAYPDETVFPTEEERRDQEKLPLVVTLHLSENAFIDLEFNDGYPTTAPLTISRYRSTKDHDRLEAAVRAVKRTALECQEVGIEGALPCCAAAFEAWNGAKHNEDECGYITDTNVDALQNATFDRHGVDSASHTFVWTSGEPLVDRKSSFQAHACRITSEKDVKIALHQLLSSCNKIMRATHNMWAYRLTKQRDGDVSEILYHDNDDDGEDGAGSRLAHLLEMRKDDRIIVVVSRWYGGIPLGPKRFAHITNVARNLLISL